MIVNLSLTRTYIRESLENSLEIRDISKDLFEQLFIDGGTFNH